MKQKNARCPDCHGTGKSESPDEPDNKMLGDCPTCAGTGVVPEEEAEAA